MVRVVNMGRPASSALFHSRAGQFVREAGFGLPAWNGSVSAPSLWHAVPADGGTGARQRLAGRPLAADLLPDTAVVGHGGHVSVGGVDLLDLVAEVGTPVFVFDEVHLRRRCRQARDGFGPGTAYAAKAFLCRAMARLVHEEGLAIDVSTGGELTVALRAGVPADRLVLHGNNKSEAELTEALRAGVGRIVVDSFDEIERLEQLVPAFLREHRPSVLLRVNPGVAPDTHAYVSTGQTDSKFGFSIPSGAAAEALGRLRRPGSPVHLVGVHTHIGSQVMELSALRAAIDAVAGLVAPFDLEELCIGGGLGVAYVSGEAAPSIAEWAELVRAACRAAGLPGTLGVTAEPGRAIAATAGMTLYRIGTIKELSGIRRYVSVDGGMSDNVRPALYGSRYEAFLPRAGDAVRPLTATIVGKHCESGDVIVRDARLPADVEVGDVVATPVTGAYGYAMASNYNKVPRPPVVFVSGGDYQVVVRRETYDDVLRLDA